MEKLTELNQFSNQENDGIWLMCQGYRCESGISYCQYVEHLKLSPCQCIFPYICFIFKFVDFDIFTIFVQPELLYRVLGLNSF